MKRCARCGQEKSLGDFYRDTRFTDGRLRGACKTCMSKARPKQHMQVQSKQCSKCGLTKPASEFVVEPRHSDGLRADCKECFYSRERYYQSLAYRQANSERVRVWNTKQRPIRLRYQARRRSEDPEWASRRDRDGHRRQFEQDPARIRAQRLQTTHRRRALKRNNGPHDLTRTQWEAIKAAYGHACAYCPATPARLTIDHVLALALGGPHSAWNIVPACLKCNLRKGARWIVVPDYSRHPFV